MLLEFEANLVIRMGRENLLKTMLLTGDLVVGIKTELPTNIFATLLNESEMWRTLK